MKIARLGLCGILGVVFTFALLVLMYSLIESGDVDTEQKDVIRISDIWQPEREITEFVREVRPERPDEPVEAPPELPPQSANIDFNPEAVSVAAPVEANINIGMAGGFARDSDYIPVFVPQPQFPRRAQDRGVSGYAVVEVVITTTGGVRDPRLIEEHPTGYGFGSAAVRAAERLRYNPRMVDGNPVEVPGVLYRFSFQIAD